MVFFVFLLSFEEILVLYFGYFGIDYRGIKIEGDKGLS